MELTTLIAHIFNFAAPAVVLALCLPLWGKLAGQKKAYPLSVPLWTAVHCAVCLTMLLLGLWFSGHDGKMVTYAAMVLAGVSVQWWGGR